MAKSDWNCCWELCLASCVAMVGAIASSFDSARAQITPDGTLGTESSVVTPTAPGSSVDVISGGAVRATNLFHSFEQFSVVNGREAYFDNAPAIQNIISRVTGGKVSNIDGLLRANGTANLFLLNPNGIVFGPNAALSIGGSFVGSTASAVNFADGSQFSATNPQAPPLLTVNVPIGLQYGGTAGSILNQSRFLQVQPGKTLALLGGDVRVDRGNLQAQGGRIELGGLAGAGTVGLNINDNNLLLSYPEGVQRASVSLSNGASVNVIAGDGGSIAVNARSLDISGASNLSAGIASGSGSVSSQAGDITLKATGEIKVSQSDIFNQVQKDAVGKAGDINITTVSAAFTNGATLNASTSGQGDAGSVNILARETVSFDGEKQNGAVAGASTNVQQGAQGNGGRINITTGSLSLTSGALLNSGTFAKGNGGSLTINARDTVSFDGEGTGKQGFPTPSGILSWVGPTGAEGNGGSVNITTGSLSLKNGAWVNAQSLGRGNAGSITIVARDLISFEGQAKTPGSFRGVLSNVEPGAFGDAGDIRIETGSFSLKNGNVAYSSSKGQGNAGSVTILARETVSFDGENSNGDPSGVFSFLDQGGIGKAGNIKIETGSLFLTNGGLLNASTEGRGDGGSVTINARDTISFDGDKEDGGGSGVLSLVGRGAEGKGGEVNITTGSLSLTNGARVITSTDAQGNAGSVTINALDTVSFDGENRIGESSGVFSSVNSGAEGKGGEVNITTGSLSLKKGALVSTSTSGQGDGGSVTINALDTVSLGGENSKEEFSGVFSSVDRGGTGKGGDINFTAGSIRLDNRGTLSATTTSGQGGNIGLQVRDFLLLANNSQISTSAGTAQTSGDSGNIKINSSFIVAVPDENSDITANAFSGSGGRVDITARSIFGLEPRSRQELQTLLGTNNPNELDPGRLPSNDITAISQTDPRLSGLVTFDTLDLDPEQGLVELPQELVDASNQITTSCAADGENNEFVVTGRGGLPPNPREPLGGEAVLTNWATLRGSRDELGAGSRENNSTNSNSSAPNQIVEATGWVTNDKGEVVLTATAPTATQDIPWLPESGCHAPKTSS